MGIIDEVLYNYLLDRGDEWTSQVQIARDLYAHFGNGECCLAPEQYHNTTERLHLLECKQSINDSAKFDKIIISNSKGMKIATETEAELYLAREYKAIFKKLKRIRTIEKKCNLHNQITVDGHTIDAFLRNLSETP